MNTLNKDIVQHLSKYIEETPEEWEKFKHFFYNSNQATMMKKLEVLKRPVWIEIGESGGDYINIRRIHFDDPGNKTFMDREGMGWYKVYFIQITMKDLVNRLNRKTHN